MPRVAKRWLDFWGRTSNNSLAFFAALATCSLAVYLPMAVAFGSMHWWASVPSPCRRAGSFAALYFFVGVASARSVSNAVWCRRRADGASVGRLGARLARRLLIAAGIAIGGHITRCDKALGGDRRDRFRPVLRDIFQCNARAVPSLRA